MNFRIFTTETTESTEAAEAAREKKVLIEIQSEFIALLLHGRATPQGRRTFFKKAKGAEFKDYPPAFLKNVLLLCGMLRKKGDLCFSCGFSRLGDLGDLGGKNLKSEFPYGKNTYGY